jgi:FkbM family methyltransferase
MIFDFIKENFNSESLIFEIGAHFGIDTEKIYGLTKATIHAFEPDPRNYKILHERGVNNIAKIVNIAISDKIGESIFYLSSGQVYTGNELLDKNDWSASSSLKVPKKHLERHPWCKFNDAVSVVTLTLDEYCRVNKIDTIDFIWCDVQGAEDLVIKGGQEMLKKTKYLYTEFCNEELYEGELNLESIIKLLPGNWEVLLFEGENVLLKRL